MPSRQAGIVEGGGCKTCHCTQLGVFEVRGKYGLVIICMMAMMDFISVLFNDASLETTHVQKLQNQADKNIMLYI